MSIWGRRVDEWFDRVALRGQAADRTTVERKTLRFLWQFGLIFLITFVLMKVLGL